MSILIKGINVHRGACYECPCLDGEYGDCNVLEKDAHYISDDECPLIELPDNGDLVDVVRCKDCKHNYSKKINKHYNHEWIVCDYWETDGLNDNDFCSHGERSEE